MIASNALRPGVLLILLGMTFAGLARGSPVAGDGDGDGDVDLADYGVFVDCVTGPGGGPVGEACADVDLDRDKDVDLQDFGGFQHVFGAGISGPLFPGLQLPVGATLYSVTAGDLDGDGDIDLAAANYLGDSVSVLLNNGNGTFGTQVAYGAGFFHISVTAADLDADGDLDLATANFQSNNISVLFNRRITP